MPADKDKRLGAPQGGAGELRKVRAGKAHPSMLESVKLDYYGTLTPISQVANVNSTDARTLVVQPWEKSMLDEISAGIIKPLITERHWNQNRQGAQKQLHGLQRFVKSSGNSAEIMQVFADCFLPIRSSKSS